MIYYCILLARPGSGPAVVRVLEQVMQATREEPGALSYAIHQAYDDPDCIHLYERYRDESAGNAHMQSAHVAAALAKFEQLLAEPPTVVRLSLRAGFGLDIGSADRQSESN